MDMGIAGRWALVGGASKGLGYGCASALALEGVNVVMVSRGSEALETAATKIRALCADSMPANGLKVPEIHTVAADITTPQGRAAIFALRKDFDIVVTNAGGPPPGDFRSWDRDAWLAALDANMLTPIELIKATVDGMAARGFGRIVNITSSAVKAPIDILGLSNGARSGLTGFVAGVARSSLAAQGVTINNLLPGIFDTDRLKSNFATQAAKAGKSAEEIKAARIAALPGKRLGNAEEFGKTCAFLCSQHAGYINGQNILMDGGSYPGTF
ncbi:SDR family oxidoreductase [Variovorax sp. PCZ-1]|uniref:SDR family oxidoreductase n=1 Tax=Variovorax sp. PCZ-1 TaxID=2835533 RepID=UPI001BCC4A96|nr:SDR family oxidoreductase [Variovorax sp. PCZ-1]MBS7808800.1 SDR family oxidoreductase [Variovorax sp. PCZ-1]